MLQRDPTQAAKVLVDKEAEELDRSAKASAAGLARIRKLI